jgi:hypothetical protein
MAESTTKICRSTSKPANDDHDDDDDDDDDDGWFHAGNEQATQQ